MNVEVVIPWRPGCRHRRAALEYVLTRHRYPVTIASGPAPWVKALAVNPAVRRSTADVVIVADADCWTDGLPDAVAAVAGGHPWAIPHDFVYRLNEQASTCYRRGGRSFRADDLTHDDLAQSPYSGYLGGGFVVARRETLVDIPLDPLFVGWGQEDEAWAAALEVLAGRPWRGSCPLIHLWHPPQPRENRIFGSDEGWRRRRAYLKARGHADRARMRKLLREGTDLSIADLIRQPCTLYRSSESDTRDAYGRPVPTRSGTATVCAVQQRQVDEPDRQGDLSDADWDVYFLATEAVGSGDTLYVPDVGVFEIVGEPWPVSHLLRGEVHHLEVKARRTAGPEDGS